MADCPWVDSHTKERARPRPPSKGKAKGDREAFRGRGKGKGKERGRPPEQARAKSTAKPTSGSSPSGKKDRKPCRNYISGTCTKGADCDYWHPPVCLHWRKGTCSEGTRCCFLYNEKPVKVRPDKTATPAKDAKPEARAKAKTKATMAFVKTEAKAKNRMAYFQANCTGPPPSVALSNSFGPFASAIAMPMVPKARACDFSCCLAGGDTQDIISKKVALHKHQTKVSRRNDKDPTYVKWYLKIKSFVPSKKFPGGPWLRGDGTPKVDFAEPEDIAWYEEQARSAAYRLYKQAHSIKELADEDFAVQHAGGAPQTTIASFVDGFADRSYNVDSGASFHLVTLNTSSKHEKPTMKYVGNPIPITAANGEV